MIHTARKPHQVETHPQRIQSMLHGVAASVRSGDLSNALRLADAAARFAPGQPAVEQVKAAVLSRIGQHEEALSIITPASPLALQAMRAQLLADAGRLDEAHRHATRLLHEHAIDAVEGLEALLGTWLRQRKIDGWEGIVSDLSGRSDGQPGGLGSQRPDRIDFSAQGWVWRHEQRLRGELRMRWAPRLPLWLALSGSVDNAGHNHKVMISPCADEEAFACFDIELPDSLHGQGCEVTLICPDGSASPLVGSPAVEAAPRTWAPAARHRERADDKLDIIIPVYGDREATLACLDSVLATIDPRLAHLIVVDDASPDRDLIQALASRLGGVAHAQLLHNPSNLGFPGAVNRGLREHRWRDVVVLNADCVVHGDWLVRLREVATAAEDIGTVTPLGRGSITGYPGLGQANDDTADLPDGTTLDAWARELLAGQSVDLPVAVGFCVLLKRDMLDQVGLLDEARFLRGYGEENDLCMRGRAAGWRDVAAAGVFVEHRGAASFGATRELWMRRNQAVLSHLHPGHDALVQQFLDSNPLHPARRVLDLARVRARVAVSKGDRALFVSLGLDGGVLRHVGDAMAQLRAAEGLALHLRPDPDFEPSPSQRLAGARVRIYLECLPLRLQDLYFDWPRESSELLEALREFSPARVELHHFMGLPEALVEQLYAFGVPVNVTVHDHAWYCPRLTLSSGDGRYCGEPDLAGCEDCVARHGTELEAGLDVARLRRRSQRWLTAAAGVTAPTTATMQRYRRHFAALPMQVRAWEPPAVEAPVKARAAEVPPRDTRVALIGAINLQKGYHVLLECAREANRLRLPLQFVVIGYTHADAPLLETGRVFITGPYQESELEALLDREHCDLAWFPSQTPETWCYALTPAMRLGLPVLGYAIGAVQERLQAHASSRCLPLDAPVPVLLNTLLDMAGVAGAFEHQESMEAIAPAQGPEAGRTGVALAPVNDDAAASLTDQNAISKPWEHPASVQTLTLPVGTYSFSVAGGRAGEPLDAAQILSTNQLRLPAMLIGPAPTPQATEVELFPAPGTLDRWLSKPGDHLTVRVHGDDVVMLLTSVRREQDRPLNIDVVRLDEPQPVPEGLAPLRLLVHVQLLGDLFFNQGRAGPVHAGLAIEAFVVDHKDPTLGNIVEYRAMTADGFETPWLTDGMLCGSRGRGVPLLGFGIRARVPAAHRHSFRYHGYFRRAGWVEADLAQEWCRSSLPDDPLEGMLVQPVDPA